MPSIYPTIRAGDFDRPEGHGAVAGDRDVERRECVFTDQTRRHLGADKIDFSVGFHLDDCRGQAIGWIGMDAEEFLRIRPANWDNRAQLFDASRLDKRLIHAKRTRIEWIRFLSRLRFGR
jgi:hypothetical protein